MTALDVADATPGWYMSANPRLSEGIIYLLTDATIDKSLQWYAFFGNGDGGACGPEYVAQAGPVVRITRPVAS